MHVLQIHKHGDQVSGNYLALWLGLLLYGGVYPREMQEVLSRGSWPQHVLRVHCWSRTAMQMHVLWICDVWCVHLWLVSWIMVNWWITMVPCNSMVHQSVINTMDSDRCAFKWNPDMNFLHKCRRKLYFPFPFFFRWWLFSFLYLC
jgi:hypothetical protein